jgi:hypothetical protein
MHAPRPACWLVDYTVCDHEILVLCASPDGTLGAETSVLSFQQQNCCLLLNLISCKRLMPMHQRSFRHVFLDSCIPNKSAITYCETGNEDDESDSVSYHLSTLTM